MNLSCVKSISKEYIAKNMGIISYLVPKKKQRWVFGAWEGKVFSDNSKYLFEYVVKNHPEIDAIWITRNKKILKNLHSLGFKCYMRFSIKGIFAALTANVAFITSHELTDISPFLNRKCSKTIQLWHGVGPKLEKWVYNGIRLFSKEHAKRFNDYYWMATSPKYIDIYSNLHYVSRDRFYITGYPRNDILFYKPANPMFERLKKEHPDCKFIIYMPTHRNFGNDSIKIDSFLYVDKILKDNNIIMVYKPHFHELKNVLHLENKLSNIILAKDSEVWGDPYSYVYYFDLLVSDYSSIAYDYLCTGKPIVLYAYDLEHYKSQDAGIADFYEEIPPGPICLTWEETLKEVTNLLRNDVWKDKREQCRRVFHPYNDGQNCTRVFDAVNLIINKE